MICRSHSRSPRRTLGACLIFCAWLSPHAAARADIFHLEQGGQVEGEWLNHAEQPLIKYLIRTSAGLTLSLPLAHVREAIRQSPVQREYHQRAPATDNTPAAQWNLAEWCRQNNLTRERLAHLRRVIELDPNHRQARALLGYQFQNGEWITKADAHRRDGYEFYRGKWRPPQEIEILESRGRQELAEKEWLAKLRRWRADLNTDKAQTAYEQLAAINDPIAVRPLADYFARERTARVKMLYADILERIRTPEALAVLVERGLADLDEEIFYYCLEKIALLNPPRISQTYIPALRDANNIRVNRAATALARLRDPSAVAPLIDALITTHTQVLPGRPGTNSDSTTAAFSPDGGTFMKKSEGPTAVIMHAHNQPVLDALNKLTAVDFGFDQRAWRYWHSQEKVAREAKQLPANVRAD
jgi:hypothetical protein